ncbi:hypothetical protein [Vibrio phage D4]|nr:hypothetical protein [Vibrio phage D4]WKV32793.1 hypothetical protein R21Y_32 [Vibrio phage vB_VhaS_R21Y]
MNTSNLNELSQDAYDHLVNAASLTRVEWTEEVREVNGVKYIKVVGTLNGKHFDTYYECNLTRRESEEAILEWIYEVFADNF